MEYKQKTYPEKATGILFPHEVTIQIDRFEQQAVLDQLNLLGVKHKDWRVKFSSKTIANGPTKIWQTYYHAVCLFADENTALLFKLSWNQETLPCR